MKTKSTTVKQSMPRACSGWVPAGSGVTHDSDHTQRRTRRRLRQGSRHLTNWPISLPGVGLLSTLHSSAPKTLKGLYSNYPSWWFKCNPGVWLALKGIHPKTEEGSLRTSGVEEVDEGSRQSRGAGRAPATPSLCSFGMPDGPNPFGPKAVNRTSIKGQVCGKAERWWSAS